MGGGNRHIYHVRGNGTLEFMRYDVATDSWEFLPDIPAGTQPKVKGGCDIAYTERHDTGYVYLLKGRSPDFLRFNTVSREWSTLPTPPFEPKATEGTWLCYDLSRIIYVHPAKSEFMYRFDAQADTWCHGVLAGMPLFNSQTGKTKKPKDGGSAGWHYGKLYAMKGGNTQDLYIYDPVADQWFERETIPSVGYLGKKHRVKGGGDAITYDDGNVPVVLLALKGGKSDELWRYEWTMTGTSKAASGPAHLAATVPKPTVSTPCARSTLTVSIHSPDAACFDATGRRVNATGLLRPGVYYLGPGHRRVVVIR
ncbi:MAG: hypothetical protein R6X13_01595 [bacterium]